MKSHGLPTKDSYFFLKYKIFPAIIILIVIFTYGCSPSWDQQAVDELSFIVDNSEIKTGKPYIKGKIIIIENNKKLEEYMSNNQKFYKFNSQLEGGSSISEILLEKINKKDLIAKNKKQAKTIVLINWEMRENEKRYKVKVSNMFTGKKYTTSIPGYIVVANIKIYDAEEKATIANEEILGPQPNNGFAIVGDIDQDTIHRGDIPIDDVVNYINQLKVIK